MDFILSPLNLVDTSTKEYLPVRDLRNISRHEGFCGEGFVIKSCCKCVQHLQCPCMFVGYYLMTLSVSRVHSVGWKDAWWFRKDLEGIGRGLIDVLYRYLSGRTEDKDDLKPQTGCRNSNQAPPECKSRALLLDQLISYVSIDNRQGYITYVPSLPPFRIIPLVRCRDGLDGRGSVSGREKICSLSIVSR
jgi:hypothetical protein